MRLLDASEIRRLLLDLGSFAEREGHVIELTIAGGAAIALLTTDRRTTRDVDAVAEGPDSKAIVERAAQSVAQRENLPPDWLNDGFKGFLRGYSTGAVVLQGPGIVVRTLSLPQLLAMKLSAWRDDVDIDDARSLIQLHSGDADEIWTGLEGFLVPGRELKARLAFQDLMESS
jgi:predicted nucleotidyltransferase